MHLAPAPVYYSQWGVCNARIRHRLAALKPIVKGGTAECLCGRLSGLNQLTNILPIICEIMCATVTPVSVSHILGHGMGLFDVL
jgi:hypothetical protein